MKEIFFVQTLSPEELRREVETWYDVFAGRKFYVWLGLAAIIGGVLYNLWRGGGTKPMLVLCLVALLFFVYMFFLHKRLAVGPVFNALKASPGVSGEVRAAISPAGTVTREAAGKISQFPLSSFALAAEVDHGVMLFVSKSGWISLKKSAFPSEDDYRRFLHNIELNRIRLEDRRREKA
ncbi:MAG: hypothetical protein VB042_04700 [Victivallaceae bacterium]|nr:hypothetical protein [Victivallaceae bacterium]